MIRAVVFDIGDVLEVIPPEFELHRRTEWERELGLSTDELDERCGDLWAAGAIGTITEAQVLAGLAQRLAVTPERVDALMALVWRAYLGTANTELIEYVRGLRPKYRTGILSNSFVGAREREQAAYGFEDLVDDIVYSHEVGMSKPDPRIYALTCERLGVLAHETVFVDDRADNIEAALAAGMHAIHHEADNARTLAALAELLGP